jgi:hypothetical protein
MPFPWLVVCVMAVAAIAWAFARATNLHAVAAVVGGGVVLWLHGIVYLDYTSDDAYISYRYAQHFADGLGLVWNPGEWVEGYTNFLWVLILAGLDKAGADVPDSARWLGFALGVIAVGGTYMLTRELLEENAGPRDSGRIAGIAAALLLAASGPFAAWSSAGLETSLFAVLTLAAVLLHIRELERGWLPASGVVWAFVAMTRPEGVLLFAVSAVFKLIEAGTRLYAQRRRSWYRRSILREAGRFALWAAGFAAIFVPYWIWRWTTYDWFFPNTYYAKVGENLDQYERGIQYLQAFAQQYAAWLVLVIPVAAALTSIRRMASVYVFALLLAWFAYVVYVGGDSLVRMRFFAPVLPLLYGAVAAAAAALIAEAHFERRPPRWAAEAAVAVAFAGLVAFTLQPSSRDQALVSEREGMRDRIAIGRWLGDHFPENTLIAVVAAGAIPYESDLPTIDMLGLNDEHIAHRDVKIGKLPAGHEKYDTEYVLDRQPDIIILADFLTDDPYDGEEDYAELKSTLIPARVDMLDNRRLWDEYDPRSIEIEEGRWFNMLVRRQPVAVRSAGNPPPR